MQTFSVFYSPINAFDALAFSAKKSSASRRNRRRHPQSPDMSICEVAPVPDSWKQHLIRLSKRLPDGLKRYFSQKIKRPFIFLHRLPEIDAIGDLKGILPNKDREDLYINFVQTPTKPPRNCTADERLRTRLRFLQRLTEPLTYHFMFNNQVDERMLAMLNEYRPSMQIGKPQGLPFMMNIDNITALKDERIQEQKSLFTLIARRFFMPNSVSNLSAGMNLYQVLWLLPALGIRPFSSKEQQALCEYINQFKSAKGFESAIDNFDLKTALRSLATIYPNTRNLLARHKRAMARKFK